MTIFLSIFIFGVLLNFIWEFLHCRLYTTCHGMKKKKLSDLLVSMSIKDGFFIILFYTITVFATGNVLITNNIRHIGLFVIIALLFSFIDEKYSLNAGRWEYSKKMPTIFGVGLSPLLEIAVTGFLAMYITFLLF